MVASHAGMEHHNGLVHQRKLGCRGEGAGHVIELNLEQGPQIMTQGNDVSCFC